MRVLKAPEQYGGLSPCTCPPGLYEAQSAQASCPWCGCGWLWTCSGCKKGFSVGITEQGMELVRYGGEVEPNTRTAPHFSNSGRKLLKTQDNWEDGAYHGPRG